MGIPPVSSFQNEGTALTSPWSIVAREPRLGVFVIERGERVLGAFARRASAGDDVGLVVTRRLSGGPPVVAPAGTVHLVLALPTPDALVPDADAARLVNRYVRPLLRALGRMGVPGRYFGRDTVVAAKQSVAWVGFAHHAGSGASVVEAFVPTERTEAMARAIEAAYREAYGEIARLEGAPRHVDTDDRPPFLSERAVPIGVIGAGNGPIGGDLLASVEVVEAANAAAPGEVAEAIAEAMAAGGVLVGALPGDLAAVALAANASPGGFSRGER
jgi:hypothetical protein